MNGPLDDGELGCSKFATGVKMKTTVDPKPNDNAACGDIYKSKIYKDKQGVFNIELYLKLQYITLPRIMTEVVPSPTSSS